jgi:CRISPR-associated endonuclease Csn1
MSARGYVLGLDLGVSSLGWAMIEIEGTGESRHAVGLLDAGVRIFEAGTEGDVEQGKDSSRGAVRREKRQPRRQLWRRQKRARRLFGLLQRVGLLPKSDGREAEHRQAALHALDADLTAKHIAHGDHLAHQKLPYLLRDAAAERRLEPFELGRALYHLAQRRGYLSNRKGAADDDEKQGKVKQGIEAITGAMDEGQTLGQFFAREVNVFAQRWTDSGQPDPKTHRIRRRYTAREMYRDEFARIRDMQQPHHPQLTAQDWKEIESAIFFQRPLKSQKQLIGRCSLERNQRRCPEALSIFQEFRILQAVNHLKVRLPDYTERFLTADERAKLVDALQTVGEMSLKSKAKKLLDLPPRSKFSLEEWEDKLPGHRTNAKMISIFGDRWMQLSPAERDAITLEVVNYRKPSALARRAQEVWGLSPDDADRLANLHLEEGHGSHSKKALQKLVPAMQDGTPYATARKALYPESFASTAGVDRLPPVLKWNRDLRNPAVTRALTEVRKVVNALVAKYGKPAAIRIELARDLKNSRDRRKLIWANNQDNRKRREKAVARILEECKLDKPSRNDVDKWMLADECNWECPYCGKTIPPSALLGSHPQFDIEHLFPRRYLDNSFGNKTLACKTCNHAKGNRLPAAAFTGERHEQIMARVLRFQGPHRLKKIDRFKMTDVPEDFVARDLTDTRYNSRLAADFLGELYGGKTDLHGYQRIYTPTGGLTALIRSAWQLNGILSETNEKTRDDHRHHAIDAIVVALSEQSLVQRMSVVAQAFEGKTDRDKAFLSGFQDPWPGFVGEVRAAINDIRVSHRPTRTLAGPLHAETIYSKDHGNEKQPDIRIRKELAKLTAKEIAGDQIVDPVIRELVQEKFQSLGGGLPSKVFSDARNHPAIPPRKEGGTPTPIHKVRLRTDAKPRTVGKGVRSRNVASGKDSNFASMVYAVLDKDGKEKKWIHEIVDRLTAHELLSAHRKQPGEKVLIPDEQEGKRRFKFALVKNDMLQLDGPKGSPVLYRVQSLSTNEIQLCEHNRAIVDTKTRTTWNRIQAIDAMRKRNAIRVVVSPDGGVAAADDLGNQNGSGLAT